MIQVVREDWHPGLNEWARGFVSGPSVEKKESGETYLAGMLADEECPLYKYIFPDGRVYFEKLQTTRFSAGPGFLLALQDKNGNWIPESLWTETEIAAAM
ncbi:MAG: hypothetical protein ACE5J0_02695 [Candidatus Paceibacterales bacterium]